MASWAGFGAAFLATIFLAVVFFTAAFLEPILFAACFATFFAFFLAAALVPVTALATVRVAFLAAARVVFITSSTDFAADFAALRTVLPAADPLRATLARVVLADALVVRADRFAVALRVVFLAMGTPFKLAK